MTRTENCKRLVSIALVSALATTALTGCASKGPNANLAASQAQTALSKGKVDVAIESAESAVQADPRNAAYRAVLGAAYMEAGRFQSAATSFDDAMSLGDSSPRTVLSYALAQIAGGNNTQAVGILHDWRSDIAPADMGLALALAGEADSGVKILANALRSGENTPKIRQNLAYAYAMQGNWRAARVMAAEDVPADQLDARLSDWAREAKPEDHQQRVASLLNVPVRADTGQPSRLALANFPSAEQLASEAAALVPVAQADAASAQAPATTPAPAQPKTYAAAGTNSYELPPLENTDISPRELVPVDYRDTPVEVVRVDQKQSAPVVGVAAYAAPKVEGPASFKEAFVAPAPAASKPVQLAQEAIRFVSNPVVQKAPARFGAATPRTASRAKPRGASDKSGESSKSPVAAGGSHLVQLGSFASEQGARRAWGIYAARWPELAKYEMVITKAKVRGKTYFRVSAGGFQQASATSMCGKVKSRGQGCFAWADGKPLPGAIDTNYRMASR